MVLRHVVSNGRLACSRRVPARRASTMFRTFNVIWRKKGSECQKDASEAPEAAGGASGDAPHAVPSPEGERHEKEEVSPNVQLEERQASVPIAASSLHQHLPPKSSKRLPSTTLNGITLRDTNQRQYVAQEGTEAASSCDASSQSTTTVGEGTDVSPSVYGRRQGEGTSQDQASKDRCPSEAQPVPFGCTDIEDLGSEAVSSTEEKASPAVVDPRPISRFRKWKLSVTDFSSQLWCERQLEFTLVTGRKRETEAMRAGTARHEALESLDHETIDVEVETREESLALRLLNTITLLEQLQKKKKARELWVFGIYDGVVLRGVVDELSIRMTGPGGQPALHILDTKTRRVKEEPRIAQKRTSAMQLQVYYWMIDELRNGRASFERLLEVYRCDEMFEFTIPELASYRNLKTLIEHFKCSFSALPPLSMNLEVAYEFEGVEFARNTIPFHSGSLHFALRDLLEWWLGGREAEAVQACESFKCRYCDFLEECEVTPLPDTTKKEVIESRRAQLAKESSNAVQPTSPEVALNHPPPMESGSAGAPQQLVEPKGSREIGATLPQAATSKVPSSFQQERKDNRVVLAGRLAATKPAAVPFRGIQQSVERRAVAVRKQEGCWPAMGAFAEESQQGSARRCATEEAALSPTQVTALCMQDDSTTAFQSKELDSTKSKAPNNTPRFDLPLEPALRRVDKTTPQFQCQAGKRARELPDTHDFKQLRKTTSSLTLDKKRNSTACVKITDFFGKPK